MWLTARVNRYFVAFPRQVTLKSLAWRSAFIAVWQISWNDGAWARKPIRTRLMRFGATRWIPKMAPCHRAGAVRRLLASAFMPVSASLLATACGCSGWHDYADLRIARLCGPRHYADQLNCWIYNNGRESCDLEGLGNRVVVRIIIM